jgi:hypothetical protein
VNYGHPDDRPAPNADKLFEFSIATGNQGWRTLLPGVKSAVQDGIPVLVTEPLALAGNASMWLLQARYDIRNTLEDLDGSCTPQTLCTCCVLIAALAIETEDTLVHQDPAQRQDNIPTVMQNLWVLCPEEIRLIRAVRDRHVEEVRRKADIVMGAPRSKEGSSWSPSSWPPSSP